MIKKWLKITIIILVIGLGPAPQLWGGIKAQETGGLGIVPAVIDINDPNGSWFVRELEAGKRIEERAAVINLYDEEVEVEVYPVDATTTKEGTFTLKQKSESYESVGGWVEGLPLTMNLQANERQIIDFSLTIPEGTEPGDYLGGLVVQKKTSDPTKMQVSSVLRTGVRIYLTVPGEVKKGIEVTEFSFKKKKGQHWLSLGIKNTGNVRLENLLVKLSLKSKWGWPPESRASYPQPAVLFPGKEIKIEVPWENSKPILGSYNLGVELLFGDSLKERKSLSLVMIDFIKLGIVVGSVSGVLLWFKLTVKSRKKKKLDRQKKRLERKQMVGLASKSGKVAKHGDEVDWLLKEIRVIVREELERLADEGKIGNYTNGNGSRKRIKAPKGLRLPRGVHSKAAQNGDRKKFFFSNGKNKKK